MPDPVRLRVVIPAHNEASRLPATLVDIAAALPELAGWQLVEILIAENGSVDQTAEVAVWLGERLGLPVRVVRYGVRGKAAALVAAMSDPATGALVDAVLFADADGATPFGSLGEFLPWRGEVVVASRHAPGALIRRPTGDSAARRAMSALMRGLTRLLFRLPIHDTQCGFKLLPAAAIGPLFGALVDRSWVFDVELLVRARRAGYELREVPVTWTEVAGSKVRPVPDALGSLRALLATRLRLLVERS